jgi:murein DD-endopeptidase MepM/ murein hydrolase activator NlpD
MLTAVAALSLAGCSGEAARLADFPGMSTSSLAKDEATATEREASVVKASLPAERPAWQNGQASTGGARSGSIVVQPGQTLYSIARANGMTAGQLAEANNIPPPYGIRVGQRLTVPGNANPASPQPSFAPPNVEAVNAPAKAAEGQPSPSVQPSAQTSASDTQVAVAAPPPGIPAPPPASGAEPAPMAEQSSQPIEQPALDSGFRWPVKGRVVSTFGQKPSGTRNEGINIAVPEGTSVRAAESGIVAYAGNELKGYGNLVLIRHDNGWVTAYAHNKELFVKRGDTVKRGDVIAKAGQTGSVTSPQVHFELRKGATPVDPMKHLGSVQAMN